MNICKVSVIICVYTMERLNDIHEAVNSVLDQTLKPYEMILAVDHNEELYERLVETYRDFTEIQGNSANLNQSPNLQSPVSIKIVLNTGAQGLSETRNVGIRAAAGDIVAFIDDDAVAEPDWLENLVRAFSLQPAAISRNGQLFQPSQSTQGTLSTQQTVVAVGGRAIPLWFNDKRPSWFPEELDWIVGCTYKGLPVETLNLEHGTLNLELRTIRNVPGCNMAFRKEVFEQAGFWETRIGSIGQSLKGGEEAELCLRIKHTIPDSLILYQPDAIIRHKIPRQRATLRWIFKNSFDQGVCKAKVQKLHQPMLKKERRTLNVEHRTRNQTLSTESSYLRYLLLTSIPKRLRQFYKKGSLSQAGAIIVSTLATGAGYLIGKIKT